MISPNGITKSTSALHAVEILRRHHLKVTAIRVSLLQVFESSPVALSTQMIERLIPIKFDRVTLYRILKKFEQLSLIHRVLDYTGKINYMLSQMPDNDVMNSCQELLHFNCKVCNAIICFSRANSPLLGLPDDYTADSVTVMVVGVCPDCAESIKSK